MRVALYARVSTADKDQDPETQLFALRDYCGSFGWEIASEYLDIASARDLRNRKQWRELMDRCARPRPGFQSILVFKLDRAFRSVKHMYEAFQVMEVNDIAFVSSTDNLDTSTASGRLLVNILGTLAQFESELTSERVQAGLARARAQGKRIGRPTVKSKNLEQAVLAVGGGMSQKKASALYGISRRTLARRLRVGKNGVADSATK